VWLGFEYLIFYYSGSKSKNRMARSNFMKFHTNNVLVMAIAFIVYYFIDWFFFHFFMPWKMIFIFQLILVCFVYSEFGTIALRWFYDCLPVQTKEDSERLLPLLNEVQRNAEQKYENFNFDKTNLYIDNSSCVNAYAMGNDTIVITRGALLQLNDEQIKGLLAHELGHIFHGDTFLSIFLMLGNYIFLFIIGLFKLVKVFFQMVAETLEDDNLKPRFLNIFFGSLYVLTLLLISALLMINSRQNEYQADHFALNIGYGENIINILYYLSILQIGNKPTLPERVLNSHPNIYNRIASLENKQKIREYLNTAKYQKV